MLNISDEVMYYVTNKFHPDNQKFVLDSFGLLEAFGLKFYEDKYINLVSMQDTIDSIDKEDMFITSLENDIRSIIEDHYITLTKNHIDIYTLNEIAHAILLICSLEDYTLVQYVLSADRPARDMFITLVVMYSLLHEFTAMEAIQEVDDKLIQAIDKLAQDKSTEISQESIEQKYNNLVNSFFSFIQNTDCIGRRLYTGGYVNMNYQDLLDLIPMSIPDYIENNLTTNITQAALDILSLLMIAKDTQQYPLLELEKQIPYIVQDTTAITKITSIIKNMLNDFKDYLDVSTATKNHEEENANQTSIPQSSPTKN
jgi:hypothetical protein